MHTSMRPLLNSGTSGSIALQSAAGRSARRLFLAPSSCTVTSTCPRSTQVLNPDVELTRTSAGASSASSSPSNASTTAAVLAAQGLERSFNSSDTVAWAPHEPHHIPEDAEHFLLRPRASQSDEPQPIASTSAPSTLVNPAPPSKRRRGSVGGSNGDSGSDSGMTLAPGSTCLHTGTTLRSQPAYASATGESNPYPHSHSHPHSHLHEDHLPTPSPPTRTYTHARTRMHSSPPAVVASSPPRLPVSWQTNISLSQQRRQQRPRPRLRPPPPPLSWPDYPYSRHPVASACSPHDTTGLKLEALFQCVLHYPRVPPKLLRFLRRELSDGPEGQLAAVTATVERLTEAVGREVAMYLIRRNSWVVLVPPESVTPRMEGVRRLLGLQPGGVPDLLRKNPNLLRMEEGTLQSRYDALQDALYDAVEFDEQKVRNLIIKYPLVLNFKQESVRSALVALRRLCSARPNWVAYYKALSPSQVAFFLRERVITLLRLEYLLLTGAGGGWTLRDIMKMSNNMFRKAYGGFRSWMQERMRRLQQRLSAARQAVEARAAAQGRQLSHEELEGVAMQVQAQYARVEQERFHRQFMARRDSERRDLETRMEQRQRSIEEKIQKEKEAAELLAKQQQGRAQAARQGEDGEDNEGKQRSSRNAGGAGGVRTTAVSRSTTAPQPASGAATATAAVIRSSSPPQPSPEGVQGGKSSSGMVAAEAHSGSGARQHPAAEATPRHQQPPPVSLSSTDPLYRVTLGHVWQRPGSKVAPEPVLGAPLP